MSCRTFFVFRLEAPSRIKHKRGTGIQLGNTGLDQLIQAMATFNADKGATVTPLTPQSYAVETNHLLAVISGAGSKGG